MSCSVWVRVVLRVVQHGTARCTVCVVCKQCMLTTGTIARKGNEQWPLTLRMQAPRTMAMVPLVSSSQPSLGSERVTRKDSAFSKRSSSMMVIVNLASLWSAW